MSFDASKESLHVLSHKAAEAEGESFKNLGVKFDGQLTMVEATRAVVREVSWKLRTLERSAKFHYDSQLVLLYKARVLGYIEYRTPALYHATDTVLEPLNKLQENFLRRLGVPQMAALMEFRLAPLAARRDMAMLGLLHRAALKLGPPQFWEFFRLAEGKTGKTRLAGKRHPRQLVETRKNKFLEVVRRSALGLVAVYNLLPAWVVLPKTVKEFQKNLSILLRQRATADCEDWVYTFSPRVPLWRHPLR